MLASGKTNRGTEETPSDQRRICQCDFKVKFVTAAFKPGMTGYVSSTLICFFHPDISIAVGIEVIENNSQFSELVSNPCARKIRNLET